jgi:hypothetical protein
VGVYSPLEAKGCDLPLSREEVNLTPLVVIASVTIYFKKRKIFALVETRALVLLIKALIAVFPLPQLLALPSKKVIIRTSTRVSINEFKDIFSDLALGCNLFNFPTLMDEERQLMKVMVKGRMDLDKDNLEVVRTLERVLTIPSYIFVMFDESFYQHLCLTSQMVFRLRLFYTCFCGTQQGVW